MEVRHSLRQCSGLVALSLLLTMPLSAFASPFENTSASEPLLLAGPIGKSSSASARVTLVIPPRPTPAVQVKTKASAREQSANTEQNTGVNRSEN